MSKTRIAINGFGRIGRLVLRAIMERHDHDLEVVAINDLGDGKTNAHLFKYDSVHGIYNGHVAFNDGNLEVDDSKIKVLSEAKPALLPWGDLKIDIVFECSGRFTDKAGASQHLEAGAGKVLISAPGTDSDLTVVYGVNHKEIKPEHKIISNASCTTNCLAPAAYILHKHLGIKHGFMTTIHAYTGDQSLVDSIHKDPRRARAAALSLIPSSTGAAKAVGLVLPELKGKLDGVAIRVPVPNVSMVDLTFVAEKATTREEINELMRSAATGELQGILSYNDEPLVSVDFNHNSASSIFDSTETQVIDGEFIRVVSWYDNEWGFSNRMIDTAGVMA